MGKTKNNRAAFNFFEPSEKYKKMMEEMLKDHKDGKIKWVSSEEVIKSARDGDCKS